ncbi:YbfB/YjiJ family MFS transporter [Leifsonia sp. AG29]|uniref:YbfB/YjiJ family MFS transporter n=1 Tax=Leifsonia sp. AG29 TaxID=2598860 RepID=UPI00131A638F|nr:YbfB/YjiJ family MFS transporter [Leifsonia sp. AG29]
MSAQQGARRRSGWLTVASTGAVLAAAMGVGRFVFTPVLPLMEAGAGLTPQGAGLLATGNYLGYLIGALLGIAVPVVSRRRSALRIGGVVLVLSLLAMPLAHDLVTWAAIRTVAGVASAIVFMVAGNAILAELTSSDQHLVGWAYGGIGAGIAVSGLLVAVVAALGDWSTAWFASAALAAALLACGWFVGERGPGSRVGTPRPGARPGHRWFSLLAASYVLEGAGYIIAGTFLVASVHAGSPGPLSDSVWIIVGLAAVPSCAVWTWLSLRVSRPTLLTGALLIQAVGIALPALSASSVAAVTGAVLFGATFVGVTTLSLATGRHLGVMSAVAVLTAGYSAGQVAGPLLVTPLLTDGYRPALLVGAAVVLLACVGAALLRIRFPHDHSAQHTVPTALQGES